MRPVSKARPRFVNGRCYTPETTKVAEDAIAFIVKAHMIKHGLTTTLLPVSITLEFSFKLPASATKRDRELLKQGKLQNIKKPDLDNLVKLVTDAMNKIAYNDDNQVVVINASKVFGDEDYIKISLMEIKDAD